MKVLVVDDQLEIRELLCSILESGGFSTQQASDGLDAMEKHKAEPSDIWLLDIFMPNLDGLETIKLIRKKQPDLPIICMSSPGMGGKNDYTAIGKRFGATATLHKPFKPNEVLDLVKDTLKIHTPS